jgi:hypothetical protein
MARWRDHAPLPSSAKRMMEGVAPLRFFQYHIIGGTRFRKA